MPNKISEKRKKYLKDYYQKKKQDPKWDEDRKAYQLEYRHNPENLKRALDKRKEKRAKLDQDPGLDEENKTYFRESKRRQMIDPEKRRTVNEDWVKRHKANLDQDPQYLKSRTLKSRCTRYGITIERYAEMVQEQDNLCAICGKPETHIALDKEIPLSIDHCHKTGNVRALLCFKCNVGLGYFNDSIEQMEESIAYLKKYARGSSNGT